MKTFTHASRSAAALCLAVPMALAGAQVANAGSAAPPAAKVTGFHGVYQFTGTPQVNNPNVSGGVLLFHWADLEPQRGVFRWDLVDAQMKVWTDHGKKVAIRVQTVVPSKTNPATPAWVYKAGVPAVFDGKYTLPLYWSPAYLSQLQTFMTAFASRYDGNPNITWFQGGVGYYGETKADKESTTSIPAWKKAGYTDVKWFATVKKIVAIYQTSLHSTPLAVSVDHSFIGGTKGMDEHLMVVWLTSQGVWPQNDGMRGGTPPKDNRWTLGPNLQEQYLSASAMGETLLADLQRAISMGGTYALIYGSDLADPNNQAALNWAMTKTTK